MRQRFFQELEQLATKDDKVFLITCDVGFSFLESFAEKFPHQFLNLGVTEQSATGVAAGLALSGYTVFLYTMIPFVTMRNFEQVRNDICYSDANVKLIGVKGSEHYKFLGISHNITENEDVIVLSQMPNLQMWTPETPDQVSNTIQAMYTTPHPCYCRL